MRMSHSRASSSRWTSVNEELEHIVALMPKLTIEEQGQWKELAYKMQHVAAPPEGFFQTVSAKDQIFGEVGKAYAAKWKDVLGRRKVSQCYVQPRCGSTSHRRRVDSTARLLPTDRRSSHIAASLFSMYDFLKDKGWTHLHLGDVAKCRLVFNHWRKSLKIGAE
ncbi:hypothetical protein HKD37_03G006308 [Glycine soja]